MHISFTGTRHGMSDKQKHALRAMLLTLNPVTFSHGCCIGADIEAHEIVRDALKGTCNILVYPSNHPVTKAPIPADSYYVASPENPLTRNTHIVNNGKGLLIAAPYESHEVLRSGTWAAIRYARKINVNVKILER